MYDLNDAQPQMPPAGELIPDGTFARIRLTIEGSEALARSNIGSSDTWCAPISRNTGS